MEAIATRLHRTSADLKVLGLGETVSLWELCAGRREAVLHGDGEGKRHVWEDEQVAAFADWLATRRPKRPSEPMWLLHRLSRECGAVAVTAAESLEYAARSLAPSIDDVVAGAPEAAFGFWVTHEEQWFRRVAGAGDEPLAGDESLPWPPPANYYAADAYEVVTWGVWLDD